MIINSVVVIFTNFINFTNVLVVIIIVIVTIALSVSNMVIDPIRLHQQQLLQLQLRLITIDHHP